MTVVNLNETNKILKIGLVNKFIIHFRFTKQFKKMIKYENHYSHKLLFIKEKITR